MKTKIFTLSLLLAVCGALKAQELEVQKVPTGHEPFIDGMIDDLDPWDPDMWIAMEQDVEGGTTLDMITQFQMLHNDEMIYFIQQVFDDTPHNEETITASYQQDCIEIIFLLSDDNSSSDFNGSTSHFRFLRNGDGETGLADGGGKSQSMIDALLADDRFEWMVTGDDDEWTLEAAFPIDVLDGDALFNGEEMFFDVKGVDNTDGTGADNTAGRTQQTYWGTPNDNKWDDASLIQGAVTLSQTELDFSVSISDTKNSMPSVYVTNDMLNFRNVKGSVRIYTITGSLVQEEFIEPNGSVEISSLNSGIYIVKTGAINVKFVK